jgi:hypothetical protein
MARCHATRTDILLSAIVGENTRWWVLVTFTEVMQISQLSFKRLNTLSDAPFESQPKSRSSHEFVCLGTKENLNMVFFFIL